MNCLYYFNPWHEMALAHGNGHFTPIKSALKMEQDLCFLMVWVADKGDYIHVLDKKLCNDYISGARVGFLDNINLYSHGDSIPEIHSIKPWGWDALLLQKMCDFASIGLLPSLSELDNIKQLSSRVTATEVLNSLVLNHKNLFVGQSYPCNTEEEVATIISRFPETILKSPWSCSGKGLNFAHGAYEGALQGWVKRILAQQGTVMVEPLYNKQADFAMEFYSNGEGAVNYVAPSCFLSDDKGRYCGNVNGVGAELLPDISALLEEELSKVLGNKYAGFLGVDMMRVMDESGKKMIHPCVEINLRPTMGLVSHLIYQKHIHPLCTSHFRVIHASNEELKQLIANSKPLQIIDGKAASGFLQLTPVGDDTEYLAYCELFYEHA